jgi:hypothetical protein
MTKSQLLFLYDYVLPNTILPNATPIEMGIIDYIHAMYSNKLRLGGFFNQNVESDRNPMKLIFGELSGMWPNSLGGPTHLQMQCYEHLLSIKESSLYIGKKKVKKYIYPIKVSYHFAEFTGVHFKGNKLNGEFFWKHISAEALNDVKEKRAIILLDWANESLITRELFNNLHMGLQMSGIPREQIILLINSFNATEVYNSWFPLDQQRLEVINLPFLMSHTSYVYNLKYKNNNTIQNFLDSQNKIRKHHFLFKIRRARDYRIAMLHALASDNLLGQGNWSCLDSITAEDGFKKSTKYRSNINFSAIQDLHTKLPRSLENEPLSNFNNVNGWNDQNSIANDNSYFYIASETFMHSEFKFVTEKVFKPIAHFQPFLFLSYPGALKQLNQLGFKTFSPFIDESYDEEEDEIKRFNLIYSEVQRLCSMSLEELHSWYWCMEEILIHNHSHLLTLYQNEPYAIEAVKYLQEKIS